MPTARRPVRSSPFARLFRRPGSVRRTRPARPGRRRPSRPIGAEPLESRRMLAGVDINGGLSWNGWTSRGFSNQLGVYGSGGTSEVYEVYTTSFAFNKSSNTITGNPVQAVEPAATGFSSGRLAYTPFGKVAVSAGAFADGNTILGVGVRVVSGGSVAGFIEA